MTRKIIAALMCILMILISAAGCKSKDSGEQTTTAPPAAETATSAPDTDASAPAQESDAAAEPTPTAEIPAASAKDTMTIAISQDPATLDPKNVLSSSLENVVRMWAEPLFDITENNERKWILATGIDEVSETNWIIHLRENVTFSNGNPFNADDVLFTLNLIEHDPTLFPSFPTLDWDTDPPKKLDDFTVELNFKNWDISIATGMPTMQFVDAESYDQESYSEHPIGTGPYIVTEYVINSHLYLEANENYWGEKAKIKNLKFKFIDEAAQIVNALEIGTVDMAAIPLQDIAYVEGLPEYTIHTKGTNGTDCVWFNTTDSSIMSNRDARKAVAHAINKDSLSSLVYFGYASIPHWPFGAGAADYQDRYLDMDDTYKIGYDPELAKQYAEKAGIMGQNIRIATNGSTNAVTAAEIIQYNLSEIGLTASIQNYDGGSWMNIVEDPTMYDFFIWGMGSPSGTAAQSHYAWFTYEKCFNGGSWEGIDRYAELAKVVSITYDEAERTKMVDEMTEIVERETIWYAFAEPQAAYAINSDISGFEFMYFNGDFYYNEYAWVK